MSFPRRFLLLAGFVLCASTAWGVPSDVAVHWLAPQPGEVVVAGTESELAWEPAAGAWNHVEEWEAFLSLDGGRTYPIRVTPHLDQDLRRVRWQVPGLPTPEARLLLRVGNEREETPVLVPLRFSIVPSPLPADRAFSSARLADGVGEPALPGQPGVVAWVEGPRRGGVWRQAVAPSSPSLAAEMALTGGRSESAVLETDESPGGDRALGSRFPALVPPGSRPRAPQESRAEAPLLALDILLLTQRQNE